ncbi:MAG: MFS transporter [Bacteroidota bacterium]
MNPRLLLFLIVFSQFAGTSLWFVGNVLVASLEEVLVLPEGAVGHLVSAVQFGFICGTFLFALLTIPDRFAPSRVFFSCALAGALCNLGIYWASDFNSLLVLRFGTGFFLAGIYPVGMKIAADWHEKGLGKALGYLVGALVLGTAFPHLLRSFLLTLPWQYILFSTSLFAAFGGLLILLFVPEGPYRKAGKQFNFRAFFSVFRERNFRAAAFGYFGHMWELYAFWAFVPILLGHWQAQQPAATVNVSLWSFVIIGIGGAACVLGGYWSQRIGSYRVAMVGLVVSGACCVLSPLIFDWPFPVFVVVLLVWGAAVIVDSPQFSTLVSQSAARNTVGTALTIVNCIGFAITIVSIQLLTALDGVLNGKYWYLCLALGPLLGILALRNFRHTSPP